ncbi:hypothetical protein ACJX0J_007493, partial [Zea mays]
MDNSQPEEQMYIINITTSLDNRLLQIHWIQIHVLAIFIFILYLLYKIHVGHFIGFLNVTLSLIILMLPFYQLMDEKIPFYAQVAMFLHVILQGSVIATDGTPISSGHYVLQGARPALSGGLGGGALWDEDTFVISLEEGHYVAYIKNYMAMYMTDEDVVVFNGMKEAVSDVFYGLSDVIDLETFWYKQVTIHSKFTRVTCFLGNFSFYVCSKFINVQTKYGLEVFWTTWIQEDEIR